MLGKPADAVPIIVIDTREQEPLKFRHLRSIRGTLPSGDYGIRGLENLFAVERKTVADLVGSVVGGNRERFERELFRLKPYQFKRLLIVGLRGEIELQRYRSRIPPKAVLGTLAAWECRYNIPVVYAATPIQAALEVERWVWYFCREYVETANALLRGCQAEPTSDGE